MVSKVQKLPLIIVVLVVTVFSGCKPESATGTYAGIRPYSGNPRYWQYQGEPVLLIGGTDNDNLFQSPGLEAHLDALREAGGNYVRNTMSSRDEGDEQPFGKTSDGLYDLGAWNEAHWQRFENLLRLTEERDIIVQIEIWDRFDHAQHYWNDDPFNPKNNVNYTYEEAGLEPEYPNNPNDNAQPFFYTVPTMRNNQVLFPYQKAFVDKLLSFSLNYGHVLYCIDNETSADPAWPRFWAEYLRSRAGEKEIHVTEMWDDWDVKHPMHKNTLDHPELYSFVDISQNSHVKDFANWENAQHVLRYISANPRPVNSVKIYGNDIGTWAQPQFDRKADHAIQSFFRNLIGGFAASRFHRPTSGIGLSERSIAALKTVREIETLVKFWDVTPRMDLLSGHDPNQAYLAANPGESYLVYFLEGGSVVLDLAHETDAFSLKWIDVNTAKWVGESTVEGGGAVTLDAINGNGCIGVLVK